MSYEAAERRKTRIRRMKTQSILKYKKIPTGTNQYPSHFIENSKAIILENKENKLIVGLCKNTTEETKSMLSFMHEGKAEFVLLKQDEITSWLAKENARSEKESVSVTENDEICVDKISEKAPTINLVNSLIFEAIRESASDIHIEAMKDNVRIRYRIDGSLEERMTVEKDRFDSISSRIKIMSNLNILEKRMPQDGRISVTLGNEKTDLRVSIVPIKYGESIVLRILGKKEKRLNLEDLGFTDECLTEIEKMLETPHGLILVTGPTGSGKTTTVNAMTRKLLVNDTKIITIEDPIECTLEGACQIQVNENAGLTFGSILKRVLRQDPNIIVVGEIRDKETARLSARSAMTGHLVISTLHTNDSISAIKRLIDLEIEGYIVSSVLRGVIAQRLIKKKTGGRIIVSECFSMTQKIRKLIEEKATEDMLEKEIFSNRKKTMKQDAMDKIVNKIITVSEARKELG